MVKSIIRAQTTYYGFATAHLLTARVPIFEANYPKPSDRGAFYQRVIDRLAERPGVAAVGATTSLPSVPYDAFAVDGKAYPTESDYPVAHSDVVSAGLFATLGVRPLTGREFERQDTATSLPVVLVNQALARKMWPHESPLGRRLRMVNSNAGNAGGCSAPTRGAGSPGEPWSAWCPTCASTASTTRSRRASTCPSRRSGGSVSRSSCARRGSRCRWSRPCAPR